MNLEIVFKDVVKPRLTIAKERVTLKIPLITTDTIMITRLTEFALKAQKQVQPTVINTLRGQIEGDKYLCITLHDDKNKYYVSVTE